MMTFTWFVFAVIFVGLLILLYLAGEQILAEVVRWRNRKRRERMR